MPRASECARNKAQVNQHLLARLCGEICLRDGLESVLSVLSVCNDTMLRAIREKVELFKTILDRAAQENTEKLQTAILANIQRF